MTTSKALNDSLAMLALSFHGELDRGTSRVYKQLLKDIPDDVLIEGVKLLIAEAASGKKFYGMPTPPEWMRACAAVIMQRRATAIRAARGQQGECETCHGTHWEEVVVEGVVRLQRCGCFERVLSAARAAGMPLALPPPPEDEHGGWD